MGKNKGKHDAAPMDHEKVFKRIEVAAVSTEGYQQAIDNAIAKASKTLHNLNWFEVAEMRGRIVNGKAVEYQVVMRLAFEID